MCVQNQSKENRNRIQLSSLNTNMSRESLKPTPAANVNLEGGVYVHQQNF